jgi:hypothetical protein
MKRTLTLTLALVGVISLFGCGNKEEEDKYKPGVVYTKEGKPATAAELANAPKAEGAFDGTPGGPGAMKKGKMGGGAPPPTGGQ